VNLSDCDRVAAMGTKFVAESANNFGGDHCFSIEDRGLAESPGAATIVIDRYESEFHLFLSFSFRELRGKGLQLAGVAFWILP